MKPTDAGHEVQRRTHEERDIRLGGALVFGAVIVLMVVFSMVAMKWTFDAWAAREAAAQTPPTSLVEQGERRPPEPRLQANPAAELQQIRRQEEAVLGSYGWTDESASIARIPIERAMEILAARGPEFVKNAVAAPDEGDGQGDTSEDRRP